MNLAKILCLIVGHDRIYGPHPQGRIFAPWQCSRCDVHCAGWTAPPAPLMPAGPLSAAAKPWNDITAQRSGSTVPTLSPRDTLVVTCERALTREQVETIKAGAIVDLPAGCKVAVLHSGLTVAAVARAHRKPFIPQPTPGCTT